MYKRQGDTSPLLETNATVPGIGNATTSGQLPELYSEEELTAVENYIVQTFGEYDFVFHEVFSPDVHVDIAIINPTRARPFHTLVTIGMGCLLYTSTVTTAGAIDIPASSAFFP